MLADAETLADEAAALEAADDLKPCRFCGSADHLDVDPVGSEDQYVFAKDLTLVRGPTGEPVTITEPCVWCQVCDVQGPITVWNATPEDGARMAAATVAAWAEYSDADGSWIGARQ